MNKLNKFSRATIAIAIMLCVALPTFAYYFKSGDLYYFIIDETNKTVEVDDCSSSITGALSIPSSVTYNSTTYSVTSIGDRAFYGCSGLTWVTIPYSVTSIGDDAFYGCTGLTSVTIPNSVTTIRDYAFSNCSGLTEVNISDLSAWCKIGFGSSGANPLSYAKKLKLNGTEIKNLVIPNDITEIKNYAFAYCYGLTSVTIPNSVTSIGGAAFLNCTGLTSVTIPNSVTTIGSSVFSGCAGLTSVTIPNSVTTIGNYAFRGCTGLTSITIPNSVTSIGDEAFNCNNLRFVKSLSNTPQQCVDNAFGSNPAAVLLVPKGSMVSYMIADGWRHFTKIQEFEVEDAVKQVLTIAYPEGGVIKQKVDNGTILELQIVPSNGWKCNSVTFNGVDVTNNLDVDGNYNTPSITADSQLSIVFVKNDGSVANALVDNDIKVCVRGNVVTITGADEFSDVEIYNTAGTTIYTGIDKSITIDSNGIYILTVEGRTFKFAM